LDFNGKGYGQDRANNAGQETNDRLRYVSNIVFAIACIRMLEKYVPENSYHQAMLSPQDWLMSRMNLSLGGRRKPKEPAQDDGYAGRAETAAPRRNQEEQM